jgi:hypothetical protein
VTQTHPEWHCRQCGFLLGRAAGDVLHIKHKEDEYFVAGSVRTPCRRCSVINETIYPNG